MATGGEFVWFTMLITAAAFLLCACGWWVRRWVNGK